MRGCSPRIKFSAGAIALFVGMSVSLTACDTTAENNTAAKLVPSDAEGFFTAALSPSVSQKAKLFGLSKHFPESAQGKDADAVKANIINDLVKDQGLNYKDDVEPWLGGEAAGAFVKPFDNSTSPLLVAFLKVKDEDKAKATFDKKHVDTASYRFVDDYAVMVDEVDVKEHQGARALDAVEQLSKHSGNSLQNTPRYKAALDSLHGEHLALGWLDLPAVMKTTKGLDRVGDALGSSNDKAIARSITNTIDEIGAVSFELYATTTSVVLQAVTEHAPKHVTSTSGDLLKRAPTNTLVAVDVADVGGLVNDFMSSDGDRTANLLRGSAEGSAQLQKDLLRTLSGEGAFIVGQAATVDQLPAAIITNTTDVTATKQALGRMTDDLRSQGYDIATQNEQDSVMYTVTRKSPFTAEESQQLRDLGIDVSALGAGDAEPYTVGVSNGRFILTNKAPFFHELANDSKSNLMTSPAYTGVVDAGSRHAANGRFYVDLESAIDLYDKAAKSTGGLPGLFGEAQAAAPASGGAHQTWLDTLRAAGGQSWVDSGHLYAELRVSLK